MGSKAADADTEHDTRLPKYLRSLLTFQGQLPARDYFIWENKEAIDAQVAKIRALDPTKPPGAPLWQQAVTSLYTDARKAEYESKIKELGDDHALYVPHPFWS